MDRWVAVRFFKITRLSQAHTPLASILETIANIDDLADREKILATHYHVRLEVFDKEGSDHVVGEMTRIQTTNLPSNISEGQRTQLDAKNRLGHSVVFRFNHKKGILGLQFSNHVLAPFRFFQYLTMWDTMAQYVSEPIIREDMWERFQSGGARYLEIGIANPSDLSVLNGDAEDVLSATKRMGDAYEAPGIVVRLSMGHRKGCLSEAVRGMVSDLLRKRSAGTLNLSSLKAKTSAADGKDDINLIEEVLERKEELQLHDRDPDANYKIKLDYIRRCMTNVG